MITYEEYGNLQAENHYLKHELRMLRNYLWAILKTHGNLTMKNIPSMDEEKDIYGRYDNGEWVLFIKENEQ